MKGKVFGAHGEKKGRERKKKEVGGPFSCYATHIVQHSTPRPYTC